MANALDGVVVGAELGGEAGGREMAETTGGGGLVEGAAEHAGVEMVVRGEAECVVEVLRGEEERETRGRGRCGVVVEVEDDFLEELEGEAEDGGRHGRRGGRVESGTGCKTDIVLRMITAEVDNDYGRSSYIAPLPNHSTSPPSTT